MKKLFLVGALALFGAANAQLAPSSTPDGFVEGDVFITGAVGFASETTGDAKLTGFTVAPSVGYFVSPNIAVGARLGFSSVKDSYDDGTFDVYEKEDLLTAGLFGRYYATPSSKFSVFGELAANYASLKETEDDGVDEDELKSNGFNIGLAPGVSYFLSKNFAIEASWGILGYSTMKPDYDGAESTDNFSIGLDLNDLTFGLVYKF